MSAQPATYALPHLTPDSALILLTLGLALIYLELNRPGSILPGSVGLLAALFAIAALFHTPLNPGSLILIAAAIALLAASLRRPTPVLISLAATLALVFGFYRLLPEPTPVHPLTALLCGLLLGAGTSILTRIAQRARANKGLD